MCEPLLWRLRSLSDARAETRESDGWLLGVIVAGTVSLGSGGCDVAVPRASAEFLPNRVRREIARTVPQSPERRIVIVFEFESYRILFIFFWYERMSTEAIKAEEQLRHRSRRGAMEDVGERERASTD